MVSGNRLKLSPGWIRVAVAHPPLPPAPPIPRAYRTAAAQGAPPLRAIATAADDSRLRFARCSRLCSIRPPAVPPTLHRKKSPSLRWSIAAATPATRANSANAAFAVGVAVPGPAPALSSAVLHTIDCSAPLAGVAARLFNPATGPDWREVVKLRASWIPWRLTLAIAGAAGAAKPGYSAPNLSGLGTIAGYNTSGVRLLTGRGINVGFDLAVAFPATAITIVASPAGRISNPGPYPERSTRSPMKYPMLPPMSNVVVDAQYDFINQVTATLWFHF